MKNFPNLPDSFVERVMALEMKVEALEITEIEQQRQTKKIRHIMNVLSWIPGGSRIFLLAILFMVFISSLTAEILLKITDVHVNIRNSLIETLTIND